jgi:hypothetical protein
MKNTPENLKMLGDKLINNGIRQYGPILRIDKDENSF